MNPKQVSEVKYRELLHDCETPCKNKYCFFRMYMEKQHLSIFIVVQVKLMEKMKYIWETEDKKDYGFDKCSMRWNDEGYAEAYRQVWDTMSEDEFLKTNVDIIFQRTLEAQKKLLTK